MTGNHSRLMKKDAAVERAELVIVIGNLHVAILDRLPSEVWPSKARTNLVNLVGLKGIVYALQSFNRFQLLIDAQRAR